MSNQQNNSVIQPYLFFERRCEEALTFYEQAIGAKVMMKVYYKENPEPAGCADMPSGDKVMHARFRVGGTTVMAADGRCKEEAEFKGFSLSLSVATEAEADKSFAALADGGEIQMPLGKTFFSPRFGMLTDKFGVSWMVIVQTEP